MDIWEDLSGVKYNTFDEFCGMAAKVLYNKIYDIVTIKLPEITISGNLFNGGEENLPELQQKWDVNKEKKDKESNDE